MFAAAASIDEGFTLDARGKILRRRKLGLAFLKLG
jgi:hypothetical protein